RSASRSQVGRSEDHSITRSRDALSIMAGDMGPLGRGHSTSGPRRGASLLRPAPPRRMGAKGRSGGRRAGSDAFHHGLDAAPEPADLLDPPRDAGLDIGDELAPRLARIARRVASDD